jgi:hypothetical protein
MAVVVKIRFIRLAGEFMKKVAITLGFCLVAMSLQAKASTYESGLYFSAGGGVTPVVISKPTGVSHVPVANDANECFRKAKAQFADRLVATHIYSDSCEDRAIVGLSCDSTCEALVKN